MPKTHAQYTAVATMIIPPSIEHPEGSGSPRLSIDANAGAFVDTAGFTWQTPA
ncbi:hypothetical protein [Nocardia callitridis]|uniref:hypothetical protein n=1 Tax=Nocardia callitridis TaxID=648753 RepID=UPI0031E92D6F